MNTLDASHPIDLARLDPTAIPDEYARLRLGALSDAALFELAAQVVSRPKQVEADSFRLHAPLELLARHALLGYVDPSRREQARERIVGLAAAYAHSAEPADDDAAERSLGSMTRDDVVAALAAAGHATIYLYLLGRAAPRSCAATAMARPLARELDRFPTWKIEWADAQELNGSGDVGALRNALLDTPRLGLPGSDFIYPIVHQVDASDVARDVLAPVISPAIDLDESSRVLSRIAAWSMLQDDPAHAPYGWTHCLTIPQAITGIARTTRDPVRTLTMAATHVVGFRAALGDRPVVGEYAPERPTLVDADSVEALDAPPAVAAAAVHHADPSDIDAVTTALATRAALHPDAHVAKYTLACLDATHADPKFARLYLAAAAYLSAWWANT